MSAEAFKRYELKYLLSAQQYDKILPDIRSRMEPDQYCKNGTDYQIFNIYYDTDDNRLIRSSLQKPYYKEKLRLRSYTSPASPDGKVFLEIKKKTGGIVHKRRVTMTLREAYDFVENGNRPQTLSYMDRQVMDEISYFLHDYTVVPTAYIGYNRQAYFGKDDRNFRITIDSDIRTRRDNVRLDSAFSGNELLPGKQYLMEVKVSSSVPLWLASLLSENKIYRIGFSKYGTEYQRSVKTCSTY